MNPGRPAAGAVQASWEHWQLPSDNDTPVRFMAAISSGGADKHLYTIQQPGGREGRTVSWGAELEPQTSFWDVSENTTFFFFFNSHSEVTFTSLIGLQPKKKNLHKLKALYFSQLHAAV